MLYCAKCAYFYELLIKPCTGTYVNVSFLDYDSKYILLFYLVTWWEDFFPFKLFTTYSHVAYICSLQDHCPATITYYGFYRTKH